jgi:hypothetical protein
MHETTCPKSLRLARRTKRTRIRQKLPPTSPQTTFMDGRDVAAYEWRGAIRPPVFTA